MWTQVRSCDSEEDDVEEPRRCEYEVGEHCCSPRNFTAPFRIEPEPTGHGDGQDLSMEMSSENTARAGITYGDSIHGGIAEKHEAQLSKQHVDPRTRAFSQPRSSLRDHRLAKTWGSSQSVRARL